jgi:hypothetical protein
MIDKESVRRMCEHEIKPSLIGEIEPKPVTALWRAESKWGAAEVLKGKEVESK